MRRYTALLVERRSGEGCVAPSAETVQDGSYTPLGRPLFIYPNLILISFWRTVRTFFEKEVVPHHDQWEKDGIVDREVWRKAGQAGLLSFEVPEEYDGPGIKDFRYNMVLTEEITRVGASGLGFALHNDITVPYLNVLCNEEQKGRWLPGSVSGDIITAIAMTEPGAGSDLQGLRTSAVDKGDHYVLNGSKTFITNGILSDLVIVVAKTDPDAGARGISLLVVEEGMEGFTRGRNLEKLGLKAQDTAELSFDDVIVPKANLLGEEGQGFIYLMQNLPQERVSIACIAIAAIEHVLDITLDYVKTREAFGKPIGKFQHNRFLVAEMATEARIARVFVDEADIAKTGLNSVNDVLQRLPSSGGGLNSKFNNSGNLGNPPDGGGVGGVDVAPVRAQLPRAQADRGDRASGPAECAVLHACLVSPRARSWVLGGPWRPGDRGGRCGAG